MFAPRSPRHSTVMACVLAATLLGPSATLAEAGAKSVFDVRKPHVNVGVSGPQRPSSFAIEMEVGDRLLRGAIVPLEPDTRVQGKRSATQVTADGLLTMTFVTQWQESSADRAPEPATLTMQAQAPVPAGGGGGGDVIVWDVGYSALEHCWPNGGGCDVIVFDIVDSVAGSGADLLELRFEAKPGELLVGRPDALFNTPGPGEPLVARLPTPAPGAALDLVLEVHSSEAGTLIPVRIKHNL